jgi:hypothetical protein
MGIFDDPRANPLRKLACGWSKENAVGVFSEIRLRRVKYGFAV